MKQLLTTCVWVLLTFPVLVAQSSTSVEPNAENMRGTQFSDSEFNLTLDINTDCWPEETTWEIEDAEGNVLYEGGPYYGQALAEITEQFWLESGTYSFSFYDAAGDGLFATQWGSLCEENGSFELVDADGNILLADTGGMDFDTLMVNFEFDASVGLEDDQLFRNLTLYPNPVSDVLNISIELLKSDWVETELVAINGQVVKRTSHGVLPVSNQIILLPMEDLPVGIYTLRLFSGQNITSRRVIKVH